MSTPDTSDFGRSVLERLRLPGPPGLRRPARIGSIASASVRFAAGTARPVEVRRSLRGPEVARVRSFRDAYTAPPRWWTPTTSSVPDVPDVASGPDEAQGTRSRPAAAPTTIRRLGTHQPLPERGLPKAVRRVPNEVTYTPGGIVAGLHAQVINVRRSEATQAAGPMLVSHDRARLGPTRQPSPPGDRAGNPSGNGSGPDARAASAVPAGAPAAGAAPAAGPSAPTPTVAAARSATAPARPAPIVSRFLTAVRRSAAQVIAPPARPASRAAARPAPAARSASSVSAAAPAGPAPSIVAAAAEPAGAAPVSTSGPGTVVDPATPDPVPVAVPVPVAGRHAAGPDAGSAAVPAAAGDEPLSAPVEPLRRAGTLRRSTSAAMVASTAAPLAGRSGAPVGGAAATPAPLRRMFGTVHPLRPAARTGDAPTRPAATPARSARQPGAHRDPAAAAAPAAPAASVAAVRRTAAVAANTTAGAQPAGHPAAAAPSAAAGGPATAAPGTAARPAARQAASAPQNWPSWAAPHQSPAAPGRAASGPAAPAAPPAASAAGVAATGGVATTPPASADAAPSSAATSAASPVRRSTAPATPPLSGVTTAASAEPPVAASEGAAGTAAVRRGGAVLDVPPGYRSGRPAGLGLASVRRFGYGHRGRSADGEIRPALSIQRLAAAGASRAPALPALPAAGIAPAAARTDPRPATPGGSRDGARPVRRSSATSTPVTSTPATPRSAATTPAITTAAATTPAATTPAITTPATSVRAWGTPAAAAAASTAGTPPTRTPEPHAPGTAAPARPPAIHLPDDAPLPVRRVTEVGGMPTHRHILACPVDCAAPATGAPAVRRLAAVAMSDLFSTSRAATPHPHSASGDPQATRTGLPTGFGPSVTIVPAGSVGGLSTGTAGPLAGLAGSGPRPTLRRAVGAPAPTSTPTSAGAGLSAAVAAVVAGEVSSALTARSGAGSVTRPLPRSATPAPDTLAASTAVRRSARPAARPVAGGAVPRISYAPAPPPISIRPAPMAGPELPASARDVRADATPGIVRRTPAGASHPPWAQPPAGRSGLPQPAQPSLVQSTAHLFTAARLADPPVRRSTDPSGGSWVSTPSDRTVRRSSDVASMEAVTPSGLPPIDLDEIVERVIDKIEERVVDELERRGRFYTPGMF